LRGAYHKAIWAFIKTVASKEKRRSG